MDDRPNPNEPAGPAPAAPSWTDERIDTIIGNLLRWGVLLSALVVLAGGIVYLARHATEGAGAYRTFPNPNEVSRDFRAPGPIVHKAAELRGRGLIALGLLLLIATPVARVAFSVFAFLRQRDLLYVLITLVVLAVLLYSLFHGHLA